MKSGTTPPNPGDDVTSAAESLLGIDLSASHVPSGPIDLDDSDLFGEPDPETPSAAEAVIAAADPDVAETVFLPAAADDDFGSDFGAGLDSVPEPAPAVPRKPAPVAAAKPAPRPVKPAPKPVKTPPEDEEQPAAPAAAAPRKDDSYWDALEGWDWGEESGSGRSESSERSGGGRDRGRGRSRGGSGGRSGGRREERSPPAAAPRSRRMPVEDDFGSGIDDQQASIEREPEADPDVSVFGLSPTESQADFLGRGYEHSADRPAARPFDDRDDLEDRGERESEPDPDVSVFDLNPTESQVRFLNREPQRRSEPPISRPAPPSHRDVEDEEEDGFGAGLEDLPSGAERRDVDSGRTSEPAEETDERGGRRGRRRRGRGRGRDAERRETGEGQTPSVGRREPLPVDEFDAEPRSAEIAESGDFGVQESRFSDVPTWAEAIGLLVKSRGGLAESGGSGGGDRGRGRSGTPSESGDRTGGGGGGGRGRGRGGRRGGGRRRSE
jgi:hypothetical protein